MYDISNELIGHALKTDIIENKYIIKTKCANTKNQHANSKLKRINQVIEKIIHTLYLKKSIDEGGPWADITSDTDFVAKSMNHSMLQATAGQLLFRCDTILITLLISDWVDIRRRKQKLIDKKNKNENKYHKPHIYRVRKKVLVHDKKQTNMRIRKRDPTILPRLGKMVQLPYVGVLCKIAYIIYGLNPIRDKNKNS